MDGYYDQEVPYVAVVIPEPVLQERSSLSERKKMFVDSGHSDLAHDSEELFQDLRLLQEAWLAEAKVPDEDEQFVPDFQAENSDFYVPVKVKKEGDCEGAIRACNHSSPQSLSYSEPCLYSPGAYQQGVADNLGGDCGTSCSPLTHHQQPNTICSALGPLHSAPSPIAGQPSPRPVSQPFGTVLPHAENAFFQDRRFQRHITQPCSAYSLGQPREPRSPFNRQVSEPLPGSFPSPVTFKQEFHDPSYVAGVQHHPMLVGSGSPMSPMQIPSLCIKQERNDCSYNIDIPSCPPPPRPVFVRDGYMPHLGKQEGETKPEIGPFREVAAFPRRGSLQLWQFLVALLEDPTHANTIVWTGRGMEFKLLDPEEVARLWGMQKNRPAMNYDKLSRSLRYYYEKGIMQKVAGERYVYKFVCNPEVVFSLAFAEGSRPLMKSELRFRDDCTTNTNNTASATSSPTTEQGRYCKAVPEPGASFVPNQTTYAEAYSF